MGMLQDLAPASFRGAGFLCPKSKVSEGRNGIVHRYPESPISYVEDNGYFPPEFSLTAVLSGNDVLSKFRALRAALNVPGPGTLRHPFYGGMLVQVKGPWTVTHEDTDLGVLTLDITFHVTSAAVFPGLATSIAAVVSSLSASFASAAMATFAGAYGTPTLSEASIEAVSSAVRSTAAAFTDLTSAPGVSLAVGHFSDVAERYIFDGEVLATELETMFRGAFEDETYTGEEITRALRKVDAALKITSDEAEAITPSTSDYTVRQSSLLTYSTYCRLVTLSSLAEAMAGTTYITANAVHDAQAFLLQVYGEIDMTAVDSTTSDGISEVVTAALATLRDMELQLPRIEAERLMVPIPASVLAYLLYEDDARTSTVVDLNVSQNPILLEGYANVLTGVS